MKFYCSVIVLLFFICLKATASSSDGGYQVCDVDKIDNLKPGKPVDYKDLQCLLDEVKRSKVLHNCPDDFDRVGGSEKPIGCIQKKFNNEMNFEYAARYCLTEYSAKLPSYVFLMAHNPGGADGKEEWTDSIFYHYVDKKNHTLIHNIKDKDVKTYAVTENKELHFRCFKPM